MKFFAPLLLAAVAQGADANWPAYLGDKAGSHYSELTLITPENVTQLQVAWTFHAGGADAQNRSQIQCNPLVIDGVLYGTSPDFQLIAVDASTGTEKWRFDAAREGLAKSGVNRGVVHWGSGDDASHVRFELAVQGKQVRLLVTHSRLATRDGMLSVSAGWHAHLDILRDRMEGREPDGFWRSHARLEAEYERRLT